jgi:uncharacterized protein YndB with AHSA1/START domain
MDKERRLGLRFEPHVGGGFIEIYDGESGEGYEIGRVTAGELGARLAYTWRQADWPEDAVTDVEVRFDPVAGGTRVSVHRALPETLQLPPTTRQPRPPTTGHKAEQPHWELHLAKRRHAVSVRLSYRAESSHAGETNL